MYDIDDLKNLVDMAAGGRSPADLLITNAKLVDVLTGEIRETDVSVGGGKILGFSHTEAVKVVDARGAYLLPGLIDAHIHIESSMVSPARFAGLVLPHGTTSVVADPHEIANVHGLEGIRYMLENGRHLPLNIFIALPSCVPATPFEDSGAVLSAEELEELIDDPKVTGIGEMMNFPGVVSGDYDVLAKIQLGTSHGKIVDGHAPGLLGRDLDAYLVTGITNTHECATLEEMRENLRRGSYILIREGSAAKNLRTLLPGVTPGNARRCAFCCDDRHIEDIVSDGHMDNHLRLAVGMGMDPVQAITMCTLNAAECFGLRNKGAIAPGRDADFILVDDLKAFRVRKVFTAGRLIAEDGRVLIPLDDAAAGAPSHSIHLKPLAEDALSLPVRTGKARVIGIEPASLVTKSLVREVKTDDAGCFQSALNPGLTKIAVIERHKRTGKRGIGILEGYGLTGGAIATTISHDSHNIVVAGDNDPDMLLAVRELADMGGGIVSVHGGSIRRLPLPIAGLMTSADPQEVNAVLHDMLVAARAELGIPEDVEPFMTLSFMALPAIPEHKLTDRVQRQHFFLRRRRSRLTRCAMPRLLPGTSPETDLYALTDDELSLGRPAVEVAKALLDSGIKILQYREKEKKAGQMLKECLELRRLTREAGACFIVNDHVDIAVLCEADGVHVGQEDLPVEAVRRLVGPDMIIGLSTHTPDQARAAVASGADYIGVGPIYPTQTKKDVCAAVTLDYLDWVVANITLPFVAIGGIKRHNIADVIAHGARCCAIVSEFVSAPDIPARVAEVRSAMKK